MSIDATTATAGKHPPRLCKTQIAEFTQITYRYQSRTIESMRTKIRKF